MEVYKKTIKLGNSSGVILPKHWLGYEVKVVVVNKPRNIKKEAIKLLENYLEELSGIYLTGSYARNEPDSASDINILALSGAIEKKIAQDKYNITIIPLEKLQKILSSNLVFFMMLREAKTILNKNLVSELKKIKLEKQAIEKEIIELRKSISEIRKAEIKNIPKAFSVLNRIFILYCIIKNKPYFKSNLALFLNDFLGLDITKNILVLYNQFRNNNKIGQKAISEILPFLSILLDKVSKTSNL